MKTCTTCGFEKSLSNFHTRGKNRKGVQSICKDCKKIKDKERRQKSEVKIRQKDNVKNIKKNIRTYIYNYLSERSCIKCGETEIACLQFDHRDPSKKLFNIANSGNRCYSQEKINAEIAKCDILCANCHAKKTAIENNWYSYIEK